MNYVADVQCNKCRERWPVRRRKIIRNPCKYCQSRDVSVVKTYGPISTEEQDIPMWCVDCETRQDATSWRQACDTCQCGGTRVPTYLTPHYSHTKPSGVPHASAVPWTKDSVVKKLANMEVKPEHSRAQKDTSFWKQCVESFVTGYHGSRKS